MYREASEAKRWLPIIILLTLVSATIYVWIDNMAWIDKHCQSQTEFPKINTFNPQQTINGKELQGE